MIANADGALERRDGVDMKNVKRTIRLGALGVAGILALGACSQGSADTDADEGDVTIRFAWWGNDERAEITNAAVDAFEAANPDITVETEFIDFNSYFDRLATATAGGDAPDVITMGGAYPREYGDRGALLDLAEVSQWLDLSVLDESALANGYFSETQYGVPTGANTFGAIINRDIFEEAGIALPDEESWTWDEFADLAVQLSDATDSDTYGAEDPTAADMLDAYLYQRTGQGLYTEDGTLAAPAEVITDWFTLTTQLRDTGGTPSASLTSELSTQTAPEQSLLGQGRAAIGFGWSNSIGALRDASGDDIVLARLPGDTGEHGSGMWLQASQLYTISSGTEHPEAAARLVDFLVGSTEAAEHIGTDRGIPSNPEIREFLAAEGLEENTQIEFDFIERVSGFVDGHFVIGPTGSTETALIVDRLNDQILFEQITPEQAGQQFVDEVTAAIS
ncbi:ABC transporter substrate-binding protein [Ruania halotolerans]|uniref:ABC transporter substrate-binding protein n=1 Tax=Ruania halotolerans TaxID=2897773 RepID=UPI001E624688|nr:sugar ABC transporter substrate-binding protein [Ruania halotolerans]UFU07197.1 sugar ABC transporter substrate-binding protein [Ruania halotolerans]